MKAPHLTISRPVTRANTLRAYQLNEPCLVKYDGTAKSIIDLIEWFNVEKSARYAATKESTFCNIYAHDLAGAMGAFLPRVWWNQANIKNAEAGEDLPVVYPRNGVAGTIVEMNANSIYEWFGKWSNRFGWREVKSKTESQNLANAGKCVIMVGANVNSRASGHITVVAPEHGNFKAAGSTGIGNVRTVIVPLQSQAGRTNWKYRAYDWQKGHERIRYYVHGA